MDIIQIKNLIRKAEIGTGYKFEELFKTEKEQENVYGFIEELEKIKKRVEEKNKKNV